METQFWIDSLAKKLIERENQLNRKMGKIRTQCGVGLSGVAHIGSLSDVLRHYGVTLGLRDQGFKSEMIAFADDRDGLRKVPAGFPEKLKEEIGKPVTDITDPFGCHKTFADHARSIWLEASHLVGVDDFVHISSTEAYKDGTFDKEILLVLKNWKKVGELIHKHTGSEKYLENYPYFPVCEGCGKIYTTRVLSFNAEKETVKYKCDRDFEGKVSSTGEKIIVKGCDHEGECKVTKSTGKMMWKVDWAMRWSALKIGFEAHGKELKSSADTADAICEKILAWKPPLHLVYELFLDKGGERISKSAGNVFTPQVWLKYGTPQSLRLLMYKRYEGARELGVVDIPKYMTEIDQLENVYFGKLKIKNEKDLKNMKRLYEYSHFLKPPKDRTGQVSYNLLKFLIKASTEEKRLEFVKKRLQRYEIHINDSELSKRIELVSNWIKAFEQDESRLSLDDKEKNLIKNVIGGIEGKTDAEEIQGTIFRVIKENGFPVKEGFSLLYQSIMGMDRGPKMGPLIADIGTQKIIEILKKQI